MEQEYLPQFVLPLSQTEGRDGLAANPERVFKVIFIGDSSVGKTSLIRRFCQGAFTPEGMRSTIGVDFHTRSLLVERQTVCLQCWDTAGQERYRAITAQYFRKSDAVVVVYDITSERSFLNAREWLENAVDGAGREVSLMLLGNKLDQVEDDLFRKVRKTEGLRLSETFTDCLFAEVSAADGKNVESSMMDLANLLKEKEDITMQKALTISLNEEAARKKKSKCCG